MTLRERNGRSSAEGMGTSPEEPQAPEEQEREEEREAREPSGTAIEDKESKEKGILVKLGESVREYAPSLISGAALGALLGEVARLNARVDIGIADLLVGDMGRKIAEVMNAPLGTGNPALWVAIGAGFGAIGFGLLKKIREEPKGFQ